MFYDIGADPTRLDPKRQVDPSLDSENGTMNSCLFLFIY